jgi:hypothetical protein
MATTRRTTRRKAAGHDAAVADRPTAGIRSTRRARPTARDRALPAEQLVAGVLDVKKALDEAIAQFSTRVSGQLGEVLRALQGHQPITKSTIKEMVERVREVRLKPEKGRLKDLIRLHDLAEELVEMLAQH